jgi:hypothetical protein
MDLPINTYLLADVREWVAIRALMNSAMSESSSTATAGSSKSPEGLWPALVWGDAANNS